MKVLSWLLAIGLVSRVQEGPAIRSGLRLRRAYFDPSTQQLHAQGWSFFQFNKCMTLNGYSTDLIPDGRYVH